MAITTEYNTAMDSFASSEFAYLLCCLQDTASMPDATDSNLPPTADAAAEHRWKGAVPSSPAPIGVWGRSPDLGVGWKCVSDASAVTEVHLRRLDAADQLHRRVVAVLTVDATPEEVCTSLPITCLLCLLIKH